MLRGLADNPVLQLRLARCAEKAGELQVALDAARAALSSIEAGHRYYDRATSMVERLSEAVDAGD